MRHPEHNKPIAGFGCGINLIDTSHDMCYDQNGNQMHMSKWTANFYLIHPEFDYTEEAVDKLVKEFSEEFKMNLMIICGYCRDTNYKESNEIKWIRHPDDNGRLPMKELLEEKYKEECQRLNETYAQKVEIPKRSGFFKSLFRIRKNKA